MEITIRKLLRMGSTARVSLPISGKRFYLYLLGLGRGRVVVVASKSELKISRGTNLLAAAKVKSTQTNPRARTVLITIPKKWCEDYRDSLLKGFFVQTVVGDAVLMVPFFPTKEVKILREASVSLQ